MKECLMVFLGGGAGSVCRYWLSTILRPLAHQGFPLGTFLANLLGCFCIGIFYGLSARLNWSAETRLFLTTGFCGGFTTFSTFSYEGDESVDFDFGNIKGKLYNSGDSYGFDTMYNNVTITSSLYGEANNINNEVNEDNVSDEISSDNTGVYIKTLYSKCEGWNHNRFLFYSDINTGNTIIGALINYTGNGTERNRIVFENKDSFLFRHRRTFRDRCGTLTT